MQWVACAPSCLFSEKASNRAASSKLTVPAACRQEAKAAGTVSFEEAALVHCCLWAEVFPVLPLDGKVYNFVVNLRLTKDSAKLVLGFALYKAKPKKGTKKSLACAPSEQQAARLTKGCFFEADLCSCAEGAQGATGNRQAVQEAN